MAMSITHRGTGVALSLGVCLSYLLVATEGRGCGREDSSDWFGDVTPGGCFLPSVPSFSSGFSPGKPALCPLPFCVP